MEESNRARAARAAEQIKLALMDEGETKFMSADLGGLGPEKWHSPYLLLTAELFDTREQLHAALKRRYNEVKQSQAGSPEA